MAKLIGIEDPLGFIEDKLVKAEPRISPAHSQESLELFLDPLDNRFAEVSFAPDMATAREVIKAHEEKTGKKAKIKVINRFCSDPNSTIIYYDLNGDQQRHAVGVYGYRLKEEHVGQFEDLYFK